MAEARHLFAGYLGTCFGLLGACVPKPGTVEDPLAGAAVAFAVRHDERTVVDVKRLERKVSSLEGTFFAAPGEDLTIVSLTTEVLTAAYVEVDLQRPEAIRLETPSEEPGCEERLSEDGTSVSLPLPAGASMLRLGRGGSEGLEQVPLPEPVLAQLRLVLPLASCGSRFRSLPFAKEARVLDSPFFLEGEWRDAASSAGRDVDFFSVFDAAYVDEDTALIAFAHGLVLLPRGGRVSSAEDPAYTHRTILPEFGSTERWTIRSVAVRPAEGERSLRVFIAGFRASLVPGAFESISALASIEGGRIRVHTATVTPGKAGRAGIDVNGHFFVPMSEANTSHRRLVVLADPDQTDRPLSIRTHAAEIKQIAPTTSPRHPHAVLTRTTNRIQLCDLRSGELNLDDSVPFAPGLETTSGHALTVLTTEGRTTILVGGEKGGLVARDDLGVWRSIARHFDALYRRSTCSPAIGPCGQVASPPELADLSVLRGDDGVAWILSAPDRCPHPLVTRIDGCSSLLEVEVPFVVENSRTVTVIRPRGDAQTALLGGRGGLFTEITSP